MNYSKSSWLAAALGFIVLAVLINPQAEAKKDKGGGGEKKDRGSKTNTTARVRDKVPLIKNATPDGGYVAKTPSGQRREVVEKKRDGSTERQIFAPGTERAQRKEVQKPDGTHQTTIYASDG